MAEIGGGGGIRTHGTRKGTTVFETAPFDHSGTPPRPAGGPFAAPGRRRRVPERPTPGKPPGGRGGVPGHR